MQGGIGSTVAWVKNAQIQKHCSSCGRGWGRKRWGGDDLVLVLFISDLPWSENWDRAEPAGTWDQ